MQVRYDSEADAIFVVLRPPAGGEAGGQRLDETRIAHLDQAGRVFAYEFLVVCLQNDRACPASQRRPWLRSASSRTLRYAFVGGPCQERRCRRMPHHHSQTDHLQ